MFIIDPNSVYLWYNEAILSGLMLRRWCLPLEEFLGTFYTHDL